MKLSIDQLKAARKDLARMLEIEEKYRAGLKTARTRASKLSKRSLHIERMLIYAQVVEQSIKYVLMSYKTKKRIETRFGVQTEDYDLRNLDEKYLTLHRLIELLRKELPNTNENKLFLEQLVGFNEYRNKFVHNLFNGENDDLKHLNQEARKYISAHVIKLIKKLNEIDDEVLDEVDRLIDSVSA